MTKISNIDVARSIKRRSKSSSKFRLSTSKMRKSISEKNLDAIFFCEELPELESRFRRHSVMNTPVRKRHEFLSGIDSPVCPNSEKKPTKTTPFKGLKSIKKSIRKLLNPVRKPKAVPIFRTLSRKISDDSVVFWEEVYPDSPIPSKRMKINSIIE
jgi:hypothetical protein